MSNLLARRVSHMDVDKFQPADVVLTRSPSWYAKLIRFGTQRRGEGKTIFNHAGIIVDYEGTMVEALGTVKSHNIVDAYAGAKSSVAIYRPTNIPKADREVICDKARSYIGDSYGYGKIVLQAFDGVLGRVGIPPFFTRFVRFDDHPMCSYLDAMSFKAAGYDFGVKAHMATPDDIGDFCRLRTDFYMCVRFLALVPRLGVR